MIGKLLEAFFRHWLLILLPPIVIPLIVAPIALYAAPSYYETFASVWVGSSPTFRDADFNAYLSPAQNQGNRLGEVMRTRAFVIEVANRTSLAPLTGSKAGQQQIQSFISRNFKMAPTGSRLLTLSFRAPTPELSYETLNAVLETFKDKASRDRTEQATGTIAFYESQLRDAEAQLARSQDGLRRYVTANPRLAAGDPGRSGSIIGGSQGAALAAAADPQLADLLRRADVDQSTVDRARRAVEQARSDTAATLQGQDINFQVVDPPQVPTDITRERKKALIYPIAALMAGLAISTGALVLLTAADRTVRFEHDLVAITGTAETLVGVVPRLRLSGSAKIKSASKADAPHLIRRAIGFVAGATPPLPAEAAIVTGTAGGKA